MSNQHWKHGGGGGGGGKKRKRYEGNHGHSREEADNGHSNGNGNESEDNNTPGGSIPIDEIKLSEDYKRKVVFTKDAPKRKYAL